MSQSHIAVGVSPELLMYGALGLGARFDAALPFEIRSGSWLVPTAGLSMAGVLADGGFAIAIFNAGLTAILGDTGRMAFRGSVTSHWFPDADQRSPSSRSASP